MAGTRLRAVLAAVLVMALSAGCAQGAAPAAPPRTVIDATGAAVALPATVDRIADAWPAHTEVVRMLGAGDRIVATVLTRSAAPWLYEIQPSLDRVPTVFTNSTVSTEELLQTRPDVLFTDRGTQIAAKTDELGIPTVQLGFQNYPDLKQMVSTTAEVLGGDAPARAVAYNDYLDRTLAQVTGRTRDLPEQARPSVLHVYSLDPLVVDGTGSIIDEWITAAGGRNAAQVQGNVTPVSTEQVAAWNPDVVILAKSAFVARDTGAQTVDKLRADPFWSRLPAVAGDRVVVNPAGGWHWARYGVESALQLRWAATVLHPDRFGDIDMVAETRSFYQQFLDHPLDDAQARRMLAAQDPE
ncbi:MULTISPECIES: ABC transporter substrate-binding protein [Pseudonocardia]|uniref:Corrinoid ABC transporter substrate-binding protein n=2 Tax=Pseudonocardia TaxID=1847 RepID=A0A1Y2MR95_PSEAH|nr:MULTISPECIES: ABC transporter substrate-binding protein [Pseudonocardia]OSY37753.1 corrinoid ABC transporter substrate-binding protein [Pseudonocardia autotrophica]TDN75757.1 iron complex transport system substrate-binding protein [Pseudonocardia autotrophica]